MIYLLAMAGWIFSAWRWGDWKHWRRYHLTFFYLCFCDVLYYFLTCHYPLWRLEPKGIVSSQAAAITIEFVIFVCSTLIYLGRFPNGLRKSVIWIAFWVILYTSIEWGLLQFGVFTYFHGWTLLKSLMFNILAFPIIRLHFTRPLLTVILSIPITILLLFLNHVPVK